MFEQALKAGLPIIAVQTDDLPNLVSVLRNYTTLKNVLVYPETKVTTLGSALYYTMNPEVLTLANYNLLVKNEHQLVAVNCASNLAFDAGSLPVPQGMVDSFLAEWLQPPQVQSIAQVLKGLSLKTIQEVCRLTMARTGGTTMADVRRTRMMVSGGVQGLYPVETTFDFYEMPEKLENWLELNSKFFLAKNIPLQLVPRGLMLAGSPGVGKTLGSKAIAKHFDIPLYRLDIATTLNKFQGTSENRVRDSLAMLERESPCVLLLDEVEKVFNGNDDTGVIQRILSQLLWWLGEHTSRILTIMTTNKIQIVPTELYRPGRLDEVINITKLNIAQAKHFSSEVFRAVMGYPPTTKQQAVMRSAIDQTGEALFSHSEVTTKVYEQIKDHNWYNIT